MVLEEAGGELLYEVVKFKGRMGLVMATKEEVSLVCVKDGAEIEEICSKTWKECDKHIHQMCVIPSKQNSYLQIYILHDFNLLTKLVINLDGSTGAAASASKPVFHQKVYTFSLF
jgi:hypothetical protein